jgi:thioredoxin-dependent peroxiredoxin
MRTKAIAASSILAALGVSAALAADMLKPGDPFPAFSLKGHDGATVTSSALAGSPYLVYFYPKADTPGCTKEACAFRDSWAEVQLLGLKVFGVSYDTPEDNRAFAEKYGLQFTLLSDRDRALAKQVGADGLMPYPSRISYLVGADGMVLKAYPKVSPAEHAAEVIADFRALVPKPADAK